MHRATIGGVSDTAAFHRHGDAEGCSRGCARRTCQGHRRERCRGVQQYRDVARANIRRGNIGPTIAAQVTHEHAFGPIADREIGWGLECAIPVAQQQAYIVAAIVGNHQVKDAVAIEVMDSDCVRAVSRRVSRLCLESAIPIA